MTRRIIRILLAVYSIVYYTSAQIENVGNQEINCTQDGFLPHSFNCRAFYWCSLRRSLRAIILECDEDKIFDTQSQTCTYPWLSTRTECGGTLHLTNEIEDTKDSEESQDSPVYKNLQFSKNLDNNCVEEGFLHDETDCVKFYRCITNGRGAFLKYEFSCGIGTVWDRDIDACNHPWATRNVRCGGRIDDNQQYYPEGQFNLPENPNPIVNQYPDDLQVPNYPGNPNLEEQPEYMEEPNLMTNFNNNKQQSSEKPVTFLHLLNDKINSNNNKQQPSEPSVNPSIQQPNQNIIYIQQSFPKPAVVGDKNIQGTSDTHCYEDGFLGDSKDCKKFYRCVEKSKGVFLKYEFTCGQGTVWDSKIGACNHQWATRNANCLNGELDGPIEPVDNLEDSGNKKPSATDPDNPNSGYNPGYNPDNGYNPQSDPGISFRRTQQPNGYNPGNDPVIRSNSQPDTRTYFRPIYQQTIENPSGNYGPEIGSSRYSTPGYQQITEQSTVATPENQNNGLSRGECIAEDFISNPNDCKKFFRCVSNGKNGFIKYEFTCGEGTVWDSDSKTCNHPSSTRNECGTGEQANIDQNTTTNEGSVLSTTSSESIFDIEVIDEDLLSTASNFEQSSTEISQSTTTNNYQFSSTLNPGQTSTINAVSISENPTSNSISGTVQSSTETNDNKLLDVCTQEGFIGDSKNCKKFYRCVGNGKNRGFTKYEFSCGEGTIWDTDISTCNYPHATRTQCGDSNQDTYGTSIRPEETSDSTTESLSSTDIPCVTESAITNSTTISTVANTTCSPIESTTSNGSLGTTIRPEETSDTPTESVGSTDIPCVTNSTTISPVENTTCSPTETTTSNFSLGTTIRPEETSDTPTESVGSTDIPCVTNSTTISAVENTTCSPTESTTSNGSLGTTIRPEETSDTPTESVGSTDIPCVTNSTTISAVENTTCSPTESTTSNGSLGTTIRPEEISDTPTESVGSTDIPCVTNSTTISAIANTTCNPTLSTTSNGSSGTTESTPEQTTSSLQLSTSGNNVHRQDYCKQEGFLANSRDCKKFYRCVANEKRSFTKYEFTCGEGTVWDSDLETCNYPAAVRNSNCGGSGIANKTEDPSQTSIVSSTQSTEISSDVTTEKAETSTNINELVSSTLTTLPSSTEQLGSTTILFESGHDQSTTVQNTTPIKQEIITIQTESGQASTTTESSNQSQTTIESAQSTTVGTTVQISTRIKEITTPSQTAQTTPAPKPTEVSAFQNTQGRCTQEGFFPNMKDCNKFYRCVLNGKGFTKYEFTCGPGTIWDPDLNTCNHAYAVSNRICEQGTIEKPETGQQTQKPQTESSSERPTSGSENICTAEGFQSNNEDCKKFFRCVANGNGGFLKYDFTCGEGTIFDPAIQTCNYPYATENRACGHTNDIRSTTDKDIRTDVPTTTSLLETTTIIAESTTIVSETTTFIDETISTEDSVTTTGGQTTEVDAQTTTQNVQTTDIQSTTTQDLQTTDIQSTTTQDLQTTDIQSTTTITQDLQTTDIQSTTTTTTQDLETTTTNEQGTTEIEKEIFATTEEQQTTTNQAETTTNSQITEFTTLPSDTTTQNNDGTTVISTTSAEQLTTITSTDSTAQTTLESTTGTTENLPTTTELQTTTILDQTTLTELSTTGIEITTSEPGSTSTDLEPTTQQPKANQTTPCPISELEGDQISLVCPTGFKRHPKYCNLFYQCINSPSTTEIKIVVLSCPDDTIFDDQKIQCLDPELSEQKCIGEIKDYVQFRKFNRISVLPMEISSQKPLCPNEGSFPIDSLKCLNNFVKCQRAPIERRPMRAYIHQCPTGFTFWPISRQCERQSPALGCIEDQQTFEEQKWMIPVEIQNVSKRM